jgi:hypothetical protein
MDILSMIDKSAPERVSKPGVVLYGPGGHLKKAPEDFNRNEKLAYIENSFSTMGPAADSNKFIIEMRVSKLSPKLFKAARAYGLHVFARWNSQRESS